jgi:hypothetical protein
MSGGKNCSLALSAQVKKYSQKNPQRIQKMPEIRSDFRGGGATDPGVIEVAQNDEQ